MTWESHEFATKIGAELHESVQTKERVIEEELSTLGEIAGLLTETLWRGNKILLFGNGGSAADAQHIAAELVSRFRRERSALPAIALTTDTSILTAIGNDYGFQKVFSRQVEALGASGDVAFGISTSGNSPNVLAAVRTAAGMGLRTVGFTGRDGGKLCADVELCFRVPSASTPRIQEAHLAAAHSLCEVIEEALSARCG
jgi:D-sedoheptulose 7-phosphate isomerase